MFTKSRVIIDTDPGTDDILAILLALSSSVEEVEVLLITLTYGNVALEKCLRNLISMFHVLDKEMEWRELHGRRVGFESLRACKPTVAVGAAHSLEVTELKADDFHGTDGLHGVHERFPDLSPGDTWKSLFENETLVHPDNTQPFRTLFIPSREPAHMEILRVLADNPPNTISIAVIGPMTNIALAAAADPEMFSRVKEVVVMGGAFNAVGNITPVAEFNVFADPVAAAILFAMTSPDPKSTMPSVCASVLPNVSNLTKWKRQLKLTLFPLDITMTHTLKESIFESVLVPLVQAGSPLAHWVHHFISSSYTHIRATEKTGNELYYILHDPLVVWYLVTQKQHMWTSTVEPEDIRVETLGRWTIGMLVSDQRCLVKADDKNETFADNGGWLSRKKGNRINRIIDSSIGKTFGKLLLKRIFD